MDEYAVFRHALAQIAAMNLPSSDTEGWGLSHAMEMHDIARKALLSRPEKPTCIRIWRFYEAPAWVHELIGPPPNGGDEDWVAWIPKEMAGYCEDLLPPVRCDSHTYVFSNGVLMVAGHS